MAKTIQTKRCPKCKKLKPISEFGKNRSRKNGLQDYCKSCQKRYRQSEKGKATNLKAVNKYHQTEKGKATCKRYEQGEKRKIAQKRYGQSKKHKATRKRFYAHHPNYRKATSAVSNAIQAGRLSRPDTLLCHYCPKPAQQYHHWHGYEKEHWLDVVPVCISCHIKQHSLSFLS